MATQPDTGQRLPDEHVPPSQGRSLGPITAPRVFVPAASLLVLFVGATAIWPDKLGEWIGEANGTVVGDLGWWYIAIVAGFVFFSLWLAFSHLGNIKLGKDDDDPDFSLMSWFAMLFAAGMGIGLMFWGVAEPLNHFAGIPRFRGDAPATDADAARAAMDTTFLHWGLHAWAIYVVVGLAVAYSVHRKGNPISIRWALEPLLGKRVLGFWGDVIDIIAVLGTLFGVATSLGLGVSQIGAGFVYLDWVDPADDGGASTALKVTLIIVITAFALASVISGVDKGIKWLSNINLGFAALLMLVVLIAGPTVFLLSDFITSIGSYLRNFFALTFDALPFQGPQLGADGATEYDGGGWVSWWTTFYWGWWISWAPFVGVFIARISKGRTVREFVTGVLLVPTTVTFLWFSILGGTAIHRELFGDGGLVTPELDADGNPIDGSRSVDTNTALFQMLDGLPLGTFTIAASLIAIALIVIFFVTSSDSGSFVVDMLSSGGNPNPPAWSRAFWAAMEGAIAAVLLLAGGGGLGALQTMAILLAAPFSIVMVLMCVATAKALLSEHRDRVRRERRWLAEDIAKEIEANNGS